MSTTELPTALTDALARAAATPGVPGVVLHTRQHGVHRTGTAGVADRSTGAPRRPDEHVRIGSTTKSFTAVVALQLVAEGALALDTALPDLPDVPALSTPPGPPVTLRHLLNHTSGLANYVLADEFLGDRRGPAMLAHRFDRFTPAQLIAIAAGYPRLAGPGAQFHYGGTNYCLVGRHIEQVTGRSLGAEIADRITRPLGLTGTTLPDTEVTLPDPHPRHYSTLYLDGGPEHDLTEQDGSGLWAGGAMVSRLDDLVTFFGALLRGDLLPADVQEQVFATVPTEGRWLPGTRYGLGVYAQRLPGGPEVWGHMGSIYGSLTAVLGTRDGTHVAAANLNTDAADPAVLTDLLDAGFSPSRRAPA